MVVVLGSMALWAAMEALGGVLLRRLAVHQIVAMRYGFHLLLLVAVLAPNNGLRFAVTRQPLLQCLRGLMMVVMPVSFAGAIREVGSDNTFAMFWMAPLLVLALAPLARERRPWWLWLAGLAGWLSALMYYAPDSAVLTPRVVYTLGMALSFALYLVLTPLLDRTDGIGTNLLYTAVVPFLVMAPFAATHGIWPDTREVFGSVAVAALGLGALAVLERALRAAPASHVGVFCASQVALGGGMDVLLAGQLPGRRLIASALLVASAMAAVVWISARERARGRASR